jgi:hypothetical protein
MRIAALEKQKALNQKLKWDHGPGVVDGLGVEG